MSTQVLVNDCMPDLNLLSDISELQRLQMLVGSIRDYAIYMLDTRGTVVSWNLGAEYLKGYRADEIIGKNFSQFFSAEDRAANFPQRALSVAAAEGRFESEGWRVRKDGSQIYVNAVIDAIRNDKGELLGFAKITRDITERKQAEETLWRSERQFKLLVQGVTDYAIYMLDLDGNITNWNLGAERIKGYSEHEVVGTHFSRFYTPEDLAENWPQTALAIAKDEGRFEREGWRIRKDGSRFFAHVIIDPLYNPDGELIGFAKITRDISERRVAAERLKHAEKALQQSQKMESIGQLTGGVAHDFNNLLQVISGNLQLLLLEVGSNEAARKWIDGALNGVARGAKLANYLLAFGRRQALDPEVVNIRRFVVGMEDILRRTLGERIDVETVVSGGLWNTLIDVSQLENALLNLAINARDAMPNGGKLTIEVSNANLDDHYVQSQPDAVVGQYVMLAVTDTGAGMTPDVVAKVFEPFFSTKPEGKGTGLGLSMVYGFVKQSGGHVQIYSEVGHGTTVKLYLPRSSGTERSDAHTPINARDLSGTETILVAEDDRELCATVVNMLEQLGYRVLKAYDAASALVVIESGAHVDLLFSDVVMPGNLSSPELARHAKKILPDLAVLFTSGYTANAIVHGGRLDPGVELLSKPYTHEALAKKIRHVLANQQHSKRLRDEIEKKRIEASEIIFSPLRILLVEDEAIIRANTQQLLTRLGHTVTSVDSIAAAMACSENSAFDLILVDMELPDGSGTELVEKIKERDSRIGVIYATGQGDLPPSVDAAILRKPYDIASLKVALSKFAQF